MLDPGRDGSVDDRDVAAVHDGALISEESVDRDVVVVGGGPAGTAAGVFTGRYGLDTVVFDRGNAALPRCAYLENYPGFPGGIPVDVFQDLLAAHLEESGCELVAETVAAVERRELDGDTPVERREPEEDTAGAGFEVTTQAGRTLTTATVIAAAWYDGSYLRPLDEPAMFSEQEHHGELEERFDPEYPDRDGRTPVAGLYVAAPNGDRNAQAVVAAGQGAHVARSLVEDRRRARGLDGEVAAPYDWLRSDSEFSGPWADRERWHEYFDTEMADTDLPADRHDALRRAFVDEAFDTRVPEDVVDERAARGLDRFAEVIGEDRLVEAVGVDRLVETAGIERVVDAVGRERLRDVLDDDGRGDATAPASPDQASHEGGE